MLALVFPWFFEYIRIFWYKKIFWAYLVLSLAQLWSWPFL